MSMTRAEEEQFVKGAFQALIDRGVASKSMLTPSTVTDADIDRFEQTFGVKLPSIFRSYLKAYCYDFTVISTGMVFLYGMEAIIWTLPNLKQFEIS